MVDKIISVIIPVYNGEKYVARAVQSVINQPEGDHIQVLIVNDGSMDSSASICDLLAEKYSNVYVIHKENGGVSSARNLGLQHVTTKYVGFLDCDDWWENGFFNAQLFNDFASENSYDVYQFAFRSTDNRCKLERVFPVNDEEIHYSAPGFGRYDWTHPCSFIYRVSLLKKHDVFYPIAKIGEDGPFVLMGLYHARSFKKINKIIFNYFENFDSCLHTSTSITAVKERRISDLQVEQYFLNIGVEYDAEANQIWTLATNLPRLCAENEFHVLSSFMNEYCFGVLKNRPDIKLRPELWNRITSWKQTPRKYWLKYRIKLGIPLVLKGILLKIPMLGSVSNYLYNRYFRGFTPVKKHK